MEVRAMADDANDLWLNEVIDHDWTAEDLDRAAALSQALRTSPEAQQRLRDYDRVRAILASDDPRTPTPAGGWSEFERRMQQSINNAATDLPASGQPRRMLAVARIAVAAVILIAVGVSLGLFIRPESAPKHIPPAATSVARSMPTPQEAQQQFDAFTQVAHTLDQRAAWMTLDTVDPTVGLVNVPLQVDRLLLVRLLAVNDQHQSSIRDVLIVPGQEAQVLTFIGDHEVRYLISTEKRSGSQPPLTLWTEYRGRRGGATLGVLATQVASGSTPVTLVGEMATVAGRVRIYVGVREVVQQEAAP
jgi:hypothetical protein